MDLDTLNNFSKWSSYLSVDDNFPFEYVITTNSSKVLVGKHKDNPFGCETLHIIITNIHNIFKCPILVEKRVVCAYLKEHANVSNFHS